MLRKMILLGGLGLMIAGCSYYEVTDTSSGRTYYTRQINDRVGGGIAFEDARTGDDVTLQNHEVHKLSHDQYEARIGSNITTVRPAAVVIPADGSSSTVITPGSSRTVVSPDGTGTIVTPPSGTVVTPGSGAVITPGRDGTVITPGSGGTVITPGSGGSVDVKVRP